MEDIEIEDNYETDSSDNDEKYSKLLDSVSQLDSTQRVKPALRKEVASEVSEFNLSKGSRGRKNYVNIKELAKALSKTPKHGVIGKKVRKVAYTSKTLPKPLEKPTEERLKRSIGFENVKKQLGRWDAIVTRNALKDQITFPLNNNSIKMQKTNEFLSQFKAATPLEEEIAKVLKEEKHTEEETEDKVFPLTLEEMLEKRKEMAQLRAKLSYRQSKAQRQSKIKSKKYHRLLKREKLKQQLKEFELLQKTDPEAALKKLEELDKTRAQERASLRHRNTGKWAKNLTVKAKYDVETRKVLAEQLKISKELTQKVATVDDSDDEVLPTETVENEPETKTTFAPSKDNPWMLEVSKEVEDFVAGYKKFWNEQGNEIEKEKVESKERKEKETTPPKENEQRTKSVEEKKKIKKASKKKTKSKLKKTEAKLKDVENDSTEFDLTIKNLNAVERPDLDEGLLEGGIEDTILDSEPAKTSTFDCSNDSKAAPSIDPTNFIQIKPKRLNTLLPDNIMSEGDTAVDDDKAQQQIIEEAFGDDDVMAEFREMKKNEEKNSKVVIDTALPGWGEWTGSGVVPKRRKKRRLVLNLPPRKDKHKKDIIINEKENPNLSNHLVKEVPHPFKSVDAFEANIRAPVGRDWVPETAHRKLIQKQVVTQLGTVIEPMSENEIVTLKKAAKSPYQGKKKKAKHN